MDLENEENEMECNSLQIAICEASLPTGNFAFLAKGVWTN